MIKNNTLYCGIRTWNEDQIETIASNYLTGTWNIGTAGSKWFTPIGNYGQDEVYPGKIFPVKVKINR